MTSQEKIEDNRKTQQQHEANEQNHHEHENEQVKLGSRAYYGRSARTEEDEIEASVERTVREIEELRKLREQGHGRR